MNTGSKVFLNFARRKHLIKQSLLLLQLEMFKNELTLYDGFEEFVKEKNIDFPPPIGSADIVFKTVRCVDDELYQSIKGMKIQEGLQAIIKKYGMDTTQEDIDEFNDYKTGEIHRVEVPVNIQDIADKLSKGEKITADDVSRPDHLLDTKTPPKKATMKMEKENAFEKPKLKRTDGKDDDKGVKIII